MHLDICPKCTHILSAPASSCPRCGVIFAKLAKADLHKKYAAIQPQSGVVRQQLCHVKTGESSLVIGIKALFLLLLTLYGFRLMLTSIQNFPDSGGWLHAVNLVFHEAGHLLFSPFGRFLQVLGGSLGQLIIPTIVIGAFLWQRDSFGAAVGTWWLGESFLDIAPYQ